MFLIRMFSAIIFIGLLINQIITQQLNWVVFGIFEFIILLFFIISFLIE